MNSAKGLFRIWIIISVLWGGLIFFTLDIYGTHARFSAYEWVLASDELDGLWPVEIIEDAVERAEAEGDQDEVMQLRRMINESQNGIYRSHDRLNYDQLKQSLEFASQVALIPPAVLGLILFGIWWISGGFAVRKKD